MFWCCCGEEITSPATVEALPVHEADYSTFLQSVPHTESPRKEAPPIPYGKSSSPKPPRKEAQPIPYGKSSSPKSPRLGLGAPLCGSSISSSTCCTSNSSNLRPRVRPDSPRWATAANRFQVILEPPAGKEGRRLGLDIIEAAGALQVKKVKEGMVAGWNSENPDMLVQPGDSIVNVNGIATMKRAQGKWASSQDLLAALTEQSEMLVLIVERKPLQGD